MKNIVNEEIGLFLNERKAHLRMINHSRNEEVFNDLDIVEDNNLEREEVVSLIRNNEWITPSPYEFSESLKKSKHQMMLTDYTVTELSKMKLFKLKDYDIGFALKDFKDKGFVEIVAVHNNSEPKIDNIGSYLMNSIINNGGCYLDHFDGKLSDIYSKADFIEISREPYNTEYDPKGEFKEKYGEQDVIYRIHKDCVNKYK